MSKLRTALKYTLITFGTFIGAFVLFGVFIWLLPHFFYTNKIVIINDTEDAKTFELLVRSHDTNEIVSHKEEAEAGENANFTLVFDAPICLGGMQFDIYRLPEEITQRVITKDIKKWHGDVPVYTIKATDISVLVLKYPCTEKVVEK